LILCKKKKERSTEKEGPAHNSSYQRKGGALAKGGGAKMREGARSFRTYERRGAGEGKSITSIFNPSRKTTSFCTGEGQQKKTRRRGVLRRRPPPNLILRHAQTAKETRAKTTLPIYEGKMLGRGSPTSRGSSIITKKSHAEKTMKGGRRKPFRRGDCSINVSKKEVLFGITEKEEENRPLKKELREGGCPISSSKKDLAHSIKKRKLYCQKGKGGTSFNGKRRRHFGGGGGCPFLFRNMMGQVGDPCPPWEKGMRDKRSRVFLQKTL